MVKELNKENIIQEIKKDKNLSEKVDETYDFVKKVKEGIIKKKELKIPRKAKVRRGKLKKGWIGILRIDENGNLSGEKQKISGSVFNTEDGTYHATEGKEVLFWNGKFPVLIQPTWKQNPINLRMKEGEENETYGDKYILAKMLKDAILVKKNATDLLKWILIAGGLYIGYQLLSGGL